MQVKDAATFQTRIKLGDSVPIQWVPIKAVGARPAGMKDVKLGPEDATARPEKKTFLERYVSSHVFPQFRCLFTVVLSVSSALLCLCFSGTLSSSW